MRAGLLRHRVEILGMDADMCASLIGRTWMGIQGKEAAEIPQASSIRNPARLDVRARYSDKLMQGRYLRQGDRLMIITSARDPLGTKAEMRITADEFIGEPAEYRPSGQVARPCRAFLQHEAPWLDDMGAVTDYKTRAEVAIIETGRVQVGDQIAIAGTTYNVIAYADGSDDGVVRGLWLEQV